MTGADPFSVHQRTSVARRVEELRYAFADDIHLIHRSRPRRCPPQAALQQTGRRLRYRRRRRDGCRAAHQSLLAA
jgi:hypothetical protein